MTRIARSLALVLLTCGCGCTSEKNVIAHQPAPPADPPQPHGAAAPANDTASTPDATNPQGAAPITVCTGNEKRDSLSIDSATVHGDTLQLQTSFGGGCNEHALGVCYNDAFAESDPVQVTAIVWHDAKADACKAMVDKTVVIDLVPLKKRFQEAYRTHAGRISLGVNGHSVDYVF